MDGMAYAVERLSCKGSRNLKTRRNLKTYRLIDRQNGVSMMDSPCTDYCMSTRRTALYTEVTDLINLLTCGKRAQVNRGATNNRENRRRCSSCVLQLDSYLGLIYSKRTWLADLSANHFGNVTDNDV